MSDDLIVTHGIFILHVHEITNKSAPSSHKQVRAA